MRLVSIMAIDPGMTTGVARGVFDLERGMVWGCMKHAMEAESFSVQGDEQEQAFALAQEWSEWHRDALMSGIPSTAVQLVCENWTPRLPLRSGKREVFYPVRIPAAMEGYLGGGLGTLPCDVIYQMPSDAMSFCTDKRLRACGRWVRGSTHQRDAWRHIALRLDALLK